jgi:hypothetical protein
MGPNPTPFRHRAAIRLAAAIGLAALATLACGLTPDAAMTEFTEGLLASMPTLPPMATLEFPAFEGDVLAPVWNQPSIPAGTLQPLVGPAPDWWYLVPVHRQATTAGSILRDYHYTAPVAPEDMTDFYEDAMQRGGWETMMDALRSGSYSYLSYTDGSTRATIYISPRDGGSLVSIIIE